MDRGLAVGGGHGSRWPVYGDPYNAQPHRTMTSVALSTHQDLELLDDTLTYYSIDGTWSRD
jgi:hypothetical protein